MFRGATRPGAHQVDRLFGPPIGVDASSWPTFKGRPIAHLITLSARLLHGASEDAGAVAVFVWSLDQHAAFRPHSRHAAVVWLAEGDLARGAPVIESHDSTTAGVALDAVTLDVPEVVLGARARLQGARWALREELARTDVLQPGRARPCGSAASPWRAGVPVRRRRLVRARAEPR